MDKDRNGRVKPPYAIFDEKTSEWRVVPEDEAIQLVLSGTHHVKEEKCSLQKCFCNGRGSRTLVPNY